MARMMRGMRRTLDSAVICRFSSARRMQESHDAWRCCLRRSARSSGKCAVAMKRLPLAAGRTG
ncbi:hypothetical protein EIJ12_05215 [Xanthomonas perforans]|nr:hypothetical protein EII98_02400 [Xanthomonas perforans]TQT03222.1 hypothetical protein EIJ44_07940 [Xanthomonas perforans]TQT07578.1 hypothetical protein EII94_05815 [Xanthomonas perforans]TQT14656.1 hypothetical protein EIJ11_14045 [Xanthomonas perforans]TQT16726.1 hypothetical protein EII99_00970 [Xanthomonas perforans]